MPMRHSINPNPNSSAIIGGTGIAVTNGNGCSTISAQPTIPEWVERSYVFRHQDAVGGETVGIYQGPIDNNDWPVFTLYQPEKQGEEKMMVLAYDNIHPSDYDTHVAFETYPILEVLRCIPGGTLLKFPD